MTNVVFIGYSAFDYVFQRSGASTYTDYTAQAATQATDPAGGVPINGNPKNAADLFFIGHTVNRFCRFRYKTLTTSASLYYIQYYNGSTWSDVPGYTVTGSNLFASTDEVEIVPSSYSWRSSWGKTTVNSVSAYWLVIVPLATSGTIPTLDWALPLLTFSNPIHPVGQEYETIGAVHRLADGSASVDSIDTVYHWSLQWNNLDYFDAASLDEAWKLGDLDSFTTGYGFTSSYTTNSGYTDLRSNRAVIDPDNPLRIDRYAGTGGNIRYVAQMGIMSK